MRVALIGELPVEKQLLGALRPVDDAACSAGEALAISHY